MTTQHTHTLPSLPHHKLVAYQVATEFLVAVRAANIRDATLRDQAARSTKSICLNIAEAAGRVSRADKARVFAIARGEAVEAAAAIEIAMLAGDVAMADAQQCLRIVGRLIALLTGLIKRRC